MKNLQVKEEKRKLGTIYTFTINDESGNVSISSVLEDMKKEYSLLEQRIIGFTFGRNGKKISGKIKYLSFDMSKLKGLDESEIIKLLLKDIGCPEKGITIDHVNDKWKAIVRYAEYDEIQWYAEYAGRGIEGRVEFELSFIKECLDFVFDVYCEPGE